MSKWHMEHKELEPADSLLAELDFNELMQKRWPIS